MGRSSLEEECNTLQVPRRMTEAESPDSFNITFSDKPFDFPRPPLPTPSSAKYSAPSFPSSPTSSSSSSYSSSSDSESDSPEDHPTKTEHPIEPLRIIKRRRSLSTAVSRAPLPHSPSSIIVASHSDAECEDSHSDNDDIGFYADQFNKILTLSSPLPPNFPGSQSQRPETMYVPAGGVSTQLDPAFSKTAAKVKRSSLAPIRHSRPAPAPPAVVISPCPSPRPPPRSSVPTDFDAELELEWEGSDEMEIIELVEDSQSARSPYPASFVPEDVSMDEESFYEYYGDEEQEVESLRHFVLPSPTRVAGDLSAELAVFGAQTPSPLSSGFPASPFSASPFPTSPTSADSLCVPMGDARLVSPISAHSFQAEFFTQDTPASPSTSASTSQADEELEEANEECHEIDEEHERALRSRWSSSTLSSLHSTTHQKHHSHSSFLLSPFKGYFNSRKHTSTSPPSTPSKARSTSPSKARSTSPVKMFTREKKSAPTPLVFVSPTSLPLPTTPSPTRPARPYAYRTEGASPASAWSFPSTPGSSSSSPSPVRQYSRRKPRTSEASCRSEASCASSASGYTGRSGARSAASFRSERSVGSDESVISCGSVMSEGGLRRKPIPVEMFLRA